MYKLTNSPLVIRTADGTLIPADLANTDYQQYLAWIAQGNMATQLDQPSQQEVIAQYETALDTHLDSIAKQYRYNDRFSFALRAGYPGPYQAEGTTFAIWMDICNQRAYTLLSDVLTGAVSLPAIEDFIESLPEFTIV